MNNIFLIGFMGTGKSTVSDSLGTMLAMDVIDMDQAITERENKSIPDIFNTYGEDYFRTLETDLLSEINSRKNTVVSCGGGAALLEQNVALMKQGGRVVLLTASPGMIYERLKNSEDRPVLKGRNSLEDIQELMEQRREKYEAAADVIIHTDSRTVPQICKELILKVTEMEEE